MLKGSDIIGKVVVTYDTGKKIERIRDLIFDQERNQLLGFLVGEKFNLGSGNVGLVGW